MPLSCGYVLVSIALCGLVALLPADGLLTMIIAGSTRRFCVQDPVACISASQFSGDRFPGSPLTGFVAWLFQNGRLIMLRLRCLVVGKGSASVSDPSG